MSLREKLLPLGSLRDKLAELVTGSYSVTKIDAPANTIKTVDKPNIIDRIKGERTETQYVDSTSLLPYKNDKYKTDYQTVEPPPKPDLPKVRKKNLFNKARAKIEGMFDDKDTPPLEASVVNTETPTPEVVEEPVVTLPPEPEPTPPISIPEEVPVPYRSGLERAITHLNRFSTSTKPDPSGRQYPPIDIKDFISKVATEGQWNPTAGNKELDYGMTQLNKGKRTDLNDTRTLWGKSWKDNFQSQLGKFNEDNPDHQLAGAAVVLAVARQELYKAFEDGRIDEPPSRENIFVAYNMDYKQTIDAINGLNYDIVITNNDGSTTTKPLQQQYRDYLNALKAKGF